MDEPIAGLGLLHRALERESSTPRTADTRRGLLQILRPP
jgi:hypothetical protein